jgi:uncharacterized protein (TIGR02266 family)
MGEDAMSPEPSGGDRRSNRRVPFEGEVRLRFDDLRDFVTEYAGNLSIGGMFVKTSSPRSPGTRFGFELNAEEDLTLVRGVGQVVWTRGESGPAGPAGMGVRFVEVDPAGRELIFRIIDRYIQHGGQPFDLEAGPGSDGGP